MNQENNVWDVTTDRFVAFFDILGFKDLVARNPHDIVLAKLEVLKNLIAQLENPKDLPQFKDRDVDQDQTKSVTFSDSIIVFSKGATSFDALKLFFDAYRILHQALANGIAVKGAISFGKITVNFEKSLFFGQPIIDAYLLHEELLMLTVILDNSVEEKIKALDKYDILKGILVEYRANLKSGKISHTLFRPYGKKLYDERIEALGNLYKSTYGKPRLYIDNTLDFIKACPVE